MSTQPKNVISGKVQTTDNQVFTVQAVGGSEQNVILDFGSSVNYQVVKLDVNDLPTGNGVTWINNFGVKGPERRCEWYDHQAGHARCAGGEP